MNNEEKKKASKSNDGKKGGKPGFNFKAFKFMLNNTNT